MLIDVCIRNSRIKHAITNRTLHTRSWFYLATETRKTARELRWIVTKWIFL